MTRSPFLLSAIVASALSTGLLLPFSCAQTGGDLRFGADPGSGDDVTPEADETAAPGCTDAACAEADAGVADCAPLLARTCGGCADSASCEAATLLSRYEPQRCAAALIDEQTFPTCTARSCDGLMERVCGGTTPTDACLTNPGCGPAQVLYERATSASSSTAESAQAEASCAAALTDDAVFAPCDG